MNSVINAIKHRRSIRKYKDKAISKKLIKEIIEAGRYAPSSHNSQPWRFVVIDNKKEIKSISDYIKKWFKKRVLVGKVASKIYTKLKDEISSFEKRANSEKDLFFYDAPVLIFICSKPGKFAVKDCSCCSQNMFLAAHSLGIGSCWIGFADLALNNDRTFMDEIGVPKGHEIIASLIFGYPLNKPDFILPRKEEAGIVKW